MEKVLNSSYKRYIAIESVKRLNFFLDKEPSWDIVDFVHNDKGIVFILASKSETLSEFARGMLNINDL